MGLRAINILFSHLQDKEEKKSFYSYERTLMLNNNAVIKIKTLSPQQCMHIYGILTA